MLLFVDPTFFNKIPKVEYFLEKIACLSHLVANRKQILDGQQMEMFRNSWFDEFLLISELKFSTQIVLGILLRQCEIKEDNEI